MAWSLAPGDEPQAADAGVGEAAECEDQGDGARSETAAPEQRHPTERAEDRGAGRCRGEHNGSKFGTGEAEIVGMCNVLAAGRNDQRGRGDRRESEGRP